MKQAHQQLNLSDIVEVLQTLCGERRTGTMFLHTDTNHSARIGMEQGRIFFVAYGRHRGMGALEQIKSMRHGKFSFAESIFNNGAEPPLPPTAELLTQLAWSAANDSSAADLADDIASERVRIPRPSAPARSAPIVFANRPLPGSPDDLDPPEARLAASGEQLYDLVAETLALSIGPVATMVCDDYRDRLVAASSPDAFRTLAAEIALDAGGPEGSGRFLSRILAAAGL
jgi:hypothetical protein